MENKNRKIIEWTEYLKRMNVKLEEQLERKNESCVHGHVYCSICNPNKK